MLALIHSNFVNTVSNQAIFVQVVHNTDDDSLILLLISDFSSMRIKEVRLNEVDDPLWMMIFHRFGSNNQLLVMKINTLFTSYEFNLFL